MPAFSNLDTHCQACGEVLSVHGHCWQCHYPPMDPALDKAAPCQLRPRRKCSYN
jgi:hypothetical protein